MTNQDAIDRVQQVLARLIGFDTTSRLSNLALIDWVSDHLLAHGVTSHRLPSPDGRKANLYATIGPPVPGGVILSGHTDVVPVDGQVWASDPFTLTERDGRLYGRGTADMKSFLAIALSLVPEMLATGLKRPIHLALSYDEEVGCLGAPAMIAALKDTLPPPAAAIIGEPTTMRVVTAHKGVNAHVTEVTGHAAHSSLIHQGVSAVMWGAHLIDWLARRNAVHAAETSPEGDGFAPPFTSVHVGTVAGGTALNIMAEHCRFVWDVRNLPGEDPDAVHVAFDRYCQETVLPQMQRIAPDCRIETRVTSAAPALRPLPDNPAEELARRLTGDNGLHKVSYAAEAGQFQEAGFSTVICGPGSIEQAHQPDEYITNEQLAAGLHFQRQLLGTLSW